MRLAALILSISAACTLATDAAAQSNDNDYTPMNSRIRRERQFPIDLHNPWGDQTSDVSRKRNRQMLNQFSKCVYNRSREGSLALLEKTDFGFVNFEQIGLDNDRALRNFGFHDCLGRVANTHGTGVQLCFSAGALRLWLVQEAYFARYDDAPSWIVAGNAIGQRTYPLSEANGGVRAAMDLADCVVAADPYSADFLYRTTIGSPEEGRALEALRPALGSCLPQGQRFQLDPYTMRVWMGEALWHAAMHSAPAPAEAQQEAAE